MAYTKPAQAPFAVNLMPGEFVIKLDTNDLVAVSVVGSVEHNTGNPVITAKARAVNADGSAKLDATGAPISSGFSHTTNKAELALAATGGMAGLMKTIVMAVLGENTGTFLNDPIHATVLDNASIRLNLNSAKTAGPLANLSALL